jgi:predicted  nucleic acid-binding Zn-ribbon protein
LPSIIQHRQQKMSHRCEHCRKTFRTAHGAKVHGNTCRFNINQYPTSKKNSIKSSTPAPRRSSRERKPVTSAGPAASEKKSGKSTVNSATRQVAQKDLERHLRALVGTIFFKDFPKHGRFRGRIIKYLTQKSTEGGHPMFHVKYDDGDNEDLTTWDLVACGVTVPVARKRNAKKNQSPPQTISLYPGNNELIHLLEYPEICTVMSEDDLSEDEDEEEDEEEQASRMEQQELLLNHPLALPPSEYGNVVATWMFTRRFSHALRLSPCSLRVFEDAVVFAGSSILLEDTFMAMTRVLLDEDAYFEMNDKKIPYGLCKSRRAR